MLQDDFERDEQLRKIVEANKKYINENERLKEEMWFLIKEIRRQKDKAIDMIEIQNQIDELKQRIKGVEKK